MDFNINVLIALSGLALLCVCLAVHGYVQAEIGLFFLAGLVSPESGLHEVRPLRLPKIDALDLRGGSEFERFLAARLRKRELERAAAPRLGGFEPFPPGWYAAC